MNIHASHTLLCDPSRGMRSARLTSGSVSADDVVEKTKTAHVIKNIWFFTNIAVLLLKRRLVTGYYTQYTERTTTNSLWGREFDWIWIFHTSVQQTESENVPFRIVDFVATTQTVNVPFRIVVGPKKGTKKQQLPSFCSPSWQFSRQDNILPLPVQNLFSKHCFPTSDIGKHVFWDVSSNYPVCLMFWCELESGEQSGREKYFTLYY